MDNFVRFLIESIVNHPENVEIREDNNPDGSITIWIKSNPEDIPLVIGKGGKNIRAIRNLARLKASIMGKNIRVQLEEDNMPQS